MIIHLKDGWRDESDEGPYTETLQCKGPWKIVRARLTVWRNGQEKVETERLFSLLKNNDLITEFSSIEDAKVYVAASEK